MNITRAEHKTQYAVISTKFFFDKNLSGLAISLLAKILALPPTWDFSVAGLVTLCQEGKSAVYRAIDELIENGYAVRKEIRNASGRITQTEYSFFEEKQVALENSFDAPLSEDPYADKPHPENETQLNNKKLNSANSDVINPFVMSVTSSFLPSSTGESRHKSAVVGGRTDASAEKTKKRKYPVLPAKVTQEMRDTYTDELKEQIEYDILCCNHRHETEELEAILDFMVDVQVCSAPYLRVNNQLMPADTVKSVYNTLTYYDIEYVLETLAKNADKIKNMQAYLLTVLYNSHKNSVLYESALAKQDVARMRA